MNKIKGTPNTIVELRTLSVGDWYWNRNCIDVQCRICPGKVIETDNRACVNVQYISGEKYECKGDLIVHPVTRVGDDWWYKGSEPKDGTDEPKADDDRLAKIEARLAALESAKAETIPPTPAGWSGWGNIRYPLPSHLDRLPEALRNTIVSYVGSLMGGCPDTDTLLAHAEVFAIAIWESRDDLFVAGEPVELLTVSGDNPDSTISVSEDASDCVYLDPENPEYGYSVLNTDALAFSRRIAAIAKRGGE